MTISELEKKLKEEHLMKFHENGALKKYVKGEEFCHGKIITLMRDVFTVYTTGDGKYSWIVTDIESGFRGVQKEYDSEEAACDGLYEYICSDADECKMMRE